MEKEIWKDIPGYEGLYQASNLGNIRSVDREVSRNGKKMLLKGNIKKQKLRNKERGNRMSVSLHKDGKTKCFNVHNLIGNTFIGKIEGLEVCHIDSNPFNNRLDNLKLDTHEENLIDQYRNGKTNNMGKLSCQEVYQIRVLYKEKFYTQYELADIYGITNSNISRIVNYKAFKFVDDKGNIRPSKTEIRYGDVI